MIIARSATGELAVEPYRLPRGLIDLPLDISLAATAKRAIRIINQAGEPIAGVSVAPARYGKDNIPHAVAQAFQARSNQAGIVELPTTAKELSAVYLDHDKSGHQFVLTRITKAGDLEAVALTSRPRKLRCLPPEDAKPADIGRIEWTVVSFQKSQEQMELAWQRVTTSGTEPVDIHLPNGSLVGFSDASSGHGWLTNDRGSELTEHTNIDFSLQRALHVTGQVVDKENGQPLAGICLQDAHSLQPTRTGTDGTYEMWVPKISDGTYPSDPFEEFFSEDAFYRRPEAEHAQGEAKSNHSN